MHKLSRLLIGAVVIIGVGLLAARMAFPFAAQPQITWSSPDVYAGITSTTTVTRTLTFTTDQALQNLSIEAVPAIAGFVQIQPNVFAGVPAGQRQTVRLTFSAPAGAQFGTYDGTIHVRAGSKTLPATLKTSVTFAAIPLPPDPGDAGKATLAGIDSDGDGVRDDVERVIGLMDVSTEQRSVLFGVVKTMQQGITTSSSGAAAVQVIKNEIVGRRCLGFLMGDQERPTMAIISAALFNTRERLLAYSAVDAQFGGQTTDDLPDGQPACGGLL
jgi:hypothetical protein